MEEERKKGDQEAELEVVAGFPSSSPLSPSTFACIHNECLDPFMRSDLALDYR